MSKFIEVIEDHQKYKGFNVDILNLKDFNKKNRLFKLAQLREIHFEFEVKKDAPDYYYFPKGEPRQYNLYYALITYQNYYLLIEIDNSEHSYVKALKASSQEEIYQAIHEDRKTINFCFGDNAFPYDEVLIHWEKIQLNSSLNSKEVTKKEKLKI